MEWVRLTLGQLSTSRKFPCNEVHCKAPQNPQPNGTSLLGINMVLRDPRLVKEMGSSSFKELSVPPSSTPQELWS